CLTSGGRRGWTAGGYRGSSPLDRKHEYSRGSGSEREAERIRSCDRGGGTPLVAPGPGRCGGHRVPRCCLQYSRVLTIANRDLGPLVSLAGGGDLELGVAFFGPERGDDGDGEDDGDDAEAEPDRKVIPLGDDHLDA